MTPGHEYDINDLHQEAQARWLKPAEVMYILQNHEKYQFAQEPPQQPTSGSLFLFNKRVLRFFRKDGHNWRKKRDGRTVGEAHERLKVGNVEALNCYYAHGEQIPSFQRRSYWMLDPAYEHIVLVHYRDTSEGRLGSGAGAQFSPGSSSAYNQSPSPYSTQNPGSTSIFGDSYEPNQSLSSSGSAEVTSDVYIPNNKMGHMDGTDADSGASTELEVTQALRRLEEQLSLNEDNFKEIAPFCINDETGHDSNPQHNQGMIRNQEQSATFPGPDDQGLFYDGYNGRQGDGGECYHELIDNGYRDANEKAIWTGVLESCKSSSAVKLPQKNVYMPTGNENSLSSSRTVPVSNQENSHWLNFNSNNAENSVFSIPQGVDGVKFPTYSIVETRGINSNYYETFFHQNQIVTPPDADSSLTVAQKQKFTIKKISPEWGYATENTKVIIVGSFFCNPSESSWACMLGDIEVPVEIIQDGVICCEAPSHLPGKVTLCITSGNRESCSEVREFEYRNKANSCTRCTQLETEATRSPEELLLLVRLGQMLLSESTTKNDNIESGIPLIKQKADDDSWSHIIEALLVGSGTSTGTIDWILEELLKDKLQQWLSCRSQERDEETGCSLSKKEQGIIHMVAGLGYEWALNPILSCGVNINFRDINGWTALHWAARFGREKTVASLIASGASAGAVTDPSAQDPIGRTAASIAASSGHKGLAGYLSEVAVTSHLSSLTLQETELSKSSAELHADMTVNSVSKDNLAASDQTSLKDTLAAIRNVTQAAARIQSAFRSHSFRKRRAREAAASTGGIGSISEISAMSKLAFRNSREDNSAALSIQKKYRGWKGRKDFLALRQKVVKIQAHVRGYQVRKHYKVLWAVGILDKVVLRWRRKGAGLRGFRQEMDSNENEDEDEDILKVFRKQKVDVEIEEAVSRVLSMVDSPDAREQYHRMLEKYRQAKAELAGTSDEASLSTSVGDALFMEDDFYPFH
ncbi:calmodulin-binding transcription activator 4 isoform X2 [Cajanus cajan]|uniref:calmodulin-binding transcription activator 4 isoform X2 n=1 Tax=Cajanus cajan TaxID=3821 RepID=UPI00098D8BCC|nr:calmodulin-binding transcription activator 4 isoform X2 [Cajanus cajan]